MTKHSNHRTPQLRTRPQRNKSSDLPPGVSGPIRVERPNGGGQWYMQVLYPTPGGGACTRRVYIGTDNTFSQEREAEATRRAVTMRDQAAAIYNQQKVKK